MDEFFAHVHPWCEVGKRQPKYPPKPPPCPKPKCKPQCPLKWPVEEHHRDRHLISERDLVYGNVSDVAYGCETPHIPQYGSWVDCSLQGCKKDKPKECAGKWCHRDILGHPCELDECGEVRPKKCLSCHVPSRV